MEKGDLGFFYHSGIKEPCVVGIVEVWETYKPDLTDPTFGDVMVKYKKELKTPVLLSTIKATSALNDLPLIKQSRLSVMPIQEDAWKILLQLGNTSI